MSGSRVLIVNADDFGRSPGINRGIIKAHLEGIVTSTTLMVNLPWSEDAVRLVRAAPNLAIGLHLNYCYGSPVSSPDEVSSLVDACGQFMTDTRKLQRVARPEEMRWETEAQIERFQTLTGQMPTHLDSHKYLHSTEPFTSVVAAVAASARLPTRAIGLEDRRTLRGSGVTTTDWFEGRFHGLDGLGVDDSILAAAIEQLAPGTTELMCHPGFSDDHIRDSSYTTDRELELAVLCSREIAGVIERCDVQLSTYRELVKAG